MSTFRIRPNHGHLVCTKGWHLYALTAMPNNFPIGSYRPHIAMLQMLTLTLLATTRHIEVLSPFSMSTCLGWCWRARYRTDIVEIMCVLATQTHICRPPWINDIPISNSGPRPTFYPEEMLRTPRHPITTSCASGTTARGVQSATPM